MELFCLLLRKLPPKSSNLGLRKSRCKKLWLKYCLYSLLAQHPSDSDTWEAEVSVSSMASWLCCPFSRRMSPGLLWKGLRVGVRVSERSRLRPHLRAVYLPHGLHGEALRAEWVWARSIPGRCCFPRASVPTWPTARRVFELLVGHFPAQLTSPPRDPAALGFLLAVFVLRILLRNWSAIWVEGVWLRGWRQYSSFPSVHPGSRFLPFLFLERGCSEL